MQIPRSVVDNMTVMVNAISGNAQEHLDMLLQTVDWTADIATIRERLIEIMQAVCGMSTDEAALVATRMYDGIRAIEIGQALGAEPVSGRKPEATDGAVRAFVQKLVDGKPVEILVRLLHSRVDYETKVAAAQSALECAKRDPRPPRFARVPSGAETCDFCLMLASRGFVYHTEAAASHTHSGCDCRVICSWKARSVEGYDPAAIYDQWQDAIDAKARERAERNGTSMEQERRHIMDGYQSAADRARHRTPAPTRRPDQSKAKNYVNDEKAAKQASILARKMRAEAHDTYSAMAAIIKFDDAWEKNTHSPESDNKWAKRVSSLMIEYGITLHDMAAYRDAYYANAM